MSKRPLYRLETSVVMEQDELGREHRRRRMTAFINIPDHLTAGDLIHVYTPLIDCQVDGPDGGNGTFLEIGEAGSFMLKEYFGGVDKFMGRLTAIANRWVPPGEEEQTLELNELGKGHYTIEMKSSRFSYRFEVRDPSDERPRGYLGAQVSAKEGGGGRDMADGPLIPSTFNRILADMVSWELSAT